MEFHLDCFTCSDLFSLILFLVFYTAFRELPKYQRKSMGMSALGGVVLGGGAGSSRGEDEGQGDPRDRQRRRKVSVKSKTKARRPPRGGPFVTKKDVPSSREGEGTIFQLFYLLPNGADYKLAGSSCVEFISGAKFTETQAGYRGGGIQQRQTDKRDGGHNKYR